MPPEQAVDSRSPAGVQEDVPRPRRRWKKWLVRLGGTLVVLGGIAAYLWFFEQTGHSVPKQPPAAVAPSGDPALDALRRGVEYLRVHQEADGHFSRGLIDPKPAFTALIVDALARAPLTRTPQDQELLDRAAVAILACQRENGSICTPAFGLDAYCTSISLLALKAMGDPKYAPAIERAKAYLLTIQRPVIEGNPTSGGVGYGASGNVDGSNTAQWVEALAEAGVEKDSPEFKNAQLFFSRLQNSPETNDLAKTGAPVGTDGGFVYRPLESKVYDQSRDGKRIPRSYGLMSYAGLKSFLYMDVAKGDPRVQSAWRWVRDNYTLDENRHIGADGLFFYYVALAKALTAYGEPVVVTTDGARHEWARELTERLLRLQRSDGSWRNERSQMWKEGDEVMVTAFAIRVLAICREFMDKHQAPKP